ncbi:MAG TPA: hypothetical protein DIW51_01980 [Rhodospirillaceae bacterium]|nr:hypothetical protein [Magnetovibrio sp.]HBT40908.1 hypothetical protein [Rhodospirillaceae bacterium]HCS68719.1 hypothetical protein [Rhodospirillaceae bacterium]|tara:strand:- start:3378 stop:5000 length:1623 start_codon:yes stop_codon:yes gene_type:complete
MAEEPEKPKSFRDPVEPETRAERLLANCILRGEPADVSGFENDTDKEVRAAFLRDLCLNAENRNIDPQGIWLRGARVTETLDLNGAIMGRSLWFADCTLMGRPDFTEAKGKSLGFAKCILPGFDADRLALEGSLTFIGATVIGETRLLGAKVGRQIECSEASFTNKGGKAFSADDLEVGGDLFFRGATAIGETRLLGVKVGGQVDCFGATFTNEGGVAFSMDRLVVEGDLVFRGATMRGETRLPGVRVGGQVDCFGTAFINEGGYAFRADGLKVGEALFFRSLRTLVAGRMSLNHASVDSLAADGSGWPESGLLDLDGFRYRTLGVYHPWTTLLGWIERQPPGEFTPQPYEQAIKVYREAGHLADAREMGIAKEDAYRKQGGLGWGHRAWLWFAKWTIAYGYKPWRALAWIFFAVMLAWMIFNSAYHQGYMRPAKERVFIHDCFNGKAASDQCSAWIERKLKWRAEPLRVPEDYPAFNGLMYSLDTFFPFVDFHQEAYWLPFAGDRFGWFFRLWLWVHIIAGWVLSTMAVAGLTGLIKKD